MIVSRVNKIHFESNVDIDQSRTLSPRTLSPQRLPQRIRILKNANQIQTGFTLIELVLVIVILGVLAATALPRFMDVSSSAHESALSGAGGALAAAVALSHAQWVANGHVSGDDVDDLTGFGLGNLNMTVDGWPSGSSGTANSESLSSSQCSQLWEGLLQSSAPTVSGATDSDYLVSSVADVNGANPDCLYTYQRDNRSNTIRYDADEGMVTTTIL